MKHQGSSLVCVALVLFASCVVAAQADESMSRQRGNGLGISKKGELKTKGLASTYAGVTSSASGIANAMSDQPGLVTSGSWPDIGSNNPSSSTAAGVGQGSLGRYMPTSGSSFGILTTGSIDIIDLTNDSSSAGVDNGVSVDGVQDLTTLRIALNAPSTAKCLRFDAVFYSEEFPEFVGSSYNDTFFATLDSNEWSYDPDYSELDAPANFAFDDNGSPLTVNSASFADDGDTGLEYNGSTRLLSSATPITPGSHSMYASIFDAGDGIYDSAAFLDNIRTTSETGSSCSSGTTLTDNDGDGLPNDWEINGLDSDLDGTVDVNLPAMGADPDHKDLFVEMDSMGGLALSSSALRLVMRAFDEAPVGNADGEPGIDLHIDAGPGSTMDIGTGAKWGSLAAGGESLPFQTSLGSFSGDNYKWNAFDLLKKSYFDPDRLPAFRYSLSVNRYGGASNDSSGIARGLPGSDFIVSLGPLCSSSGSCGPGGPGGLLPQGGTFMHELGHTLGLHHGGDDDANYEPNYLSVMNYMFQGVGTMPGGKLNITGGFASAPAVLDYSRFGQDVLPPVDENSLDETDGYSYSGSEADGYDTFTYCSEFIGLVKYWKPVSASGPVDFNCDGDTTDWSVSKDVNNYNSKTVLDGTNDWNRISYRGGAVGGYGLETLLEGETEDDEVPVSDVMQFAEAVYEAPVVVTGGISKLSSTAATAMGSVSPDGPTESMVEFGQGDSLDSNTPVIAIGAPGDTQFEIKGLQPATTYSYRVAARGPVSDWVYGDIRTFNTPLVDGDGIGTSARCKRARASLTKVENRFRRAKGDVSKAKKRLKKTRGSRNTRIRSKRSRKLTKAKERVKTAKKSLRKQKKRAKSACR